MDDCREKLKLVEGSFELAMMKRNDAADFLARKGKDRNEELVAFEKMPQCMGHILLEDYGFCDAEQQKKEGVKDL